MEGRKDGLITVFLLTMASQLIVLRGNSGSGKTTTANALKAALPKGKVFLLSQDTLRREILGVKDRVGGLTAPLLENLISFGEKYYPYILVEGIFPKAIYEETFFHLNETFKQNAYFYYFNLSYPETIKRHQNRQLNCDFGPEEMKGWYLENDLLEVPQEKIFIENATLQEQVQQILKDLKR